MERDRDQDRRVCAWPGYSWLFDRAAFGNRLSGDRSAVWSDYRDYRRYSRGDPIRWTDYHVGSGWPSRAECLTDDGFAGGRHRDGHPVSRKHDRGAAPDG